MRQSAQHILSLALGLKITLVTGMLQVFSINIYALLDVDDTLSFVTLLVPNNFDVILDILIEPFSLTTLVGDSVAARRVFRSCPISLPNRFT